jgi:two-component system, response regulator
MPNQNMEVLLVEDNADDIELVLRVLRQHYPQLRIEVVRDSVSALDYLFSTGKYANRPFHRTPKLVLLDIGLPGNSGLNVLQVMKAYTRTKAIPVVVFTGNPEDKTKVKSYELGANSFVVKPTNYEDFQQVVQDIGTYWLSRNDELSEQIPG